MSRTLWITLGLSAAVILTVLSVLLGSSCAGDSGSAFRGEAVGVIEVEGIISDARATVREIRRFTKEKGIPAILLRVNSPGGIVEPAQEIYTELKRAKAEGKKIVVSMGALAASGGYLIATPADVIVAGPGTMTGSIGVIMTFPNVEGLFRKLGLGVEVIKSKEFKDIGSPYRPMKPEERVMLKDMVLDVYDQFVTAVAEDRALARESVEKLADGRIFSGRQAKQAGLVDTLGTYEDALRIAGKLAGITGEPRVVRLPRPFRLRDLLREEITSRLFSPQLLFLFR